MSYIVAVPARLDSKRLNRKLMHVINGKTVLMHTLDKITKVVNNDKVYVFCDDKILSNEAEKHNFSSVMVEEECVNGTERICKGLKNLNKNISFDFVLIIHADQPMIEEENIKEILDYWSKSSKDKDTMYTLHTKCDEYNNESIAKIVFNQDGRWLYISRKDIPSNYGKKTQMYKHFGLCMFSRELLEIYVNMKNNPLQLSEDNEWLKLLENGYKITSKEIDHHDTDLNTPEDLIYIEKKLNV